MPVKITRLPDDDEHYDEAWERTTEEPDILDVSASKLAGEPWWQVGIAVAEFMRSGPLAIEFRQRIAVALSAVAGVERVDEEDTEVWLVTGQPTAEALIHAAAAVLDDMAPRLRAHVANPPGPRLVSWP